MRLPKPLLFLLLFAVACAPGEGLDAGPDADAGADADAGPAGDAGPPSDAGSLDAGEASCELDPVLGTLELAAGFQVAGSAPLPAGVSSVAAVPSDATYRIYGIDMLSLDVVDLGDWPALGDGEPAFSLLPEGTPAAESFASPFLATDGAWLSGGYTGAFDAELGVAPGKLARWEIGAGEPPSYLDAPNVFTGTYFGASLLVSGGGLGGLTGAGVYAAVDDDALLLAEYVPQWHAFSGLTAATSSGTVFVSAWFAASPEEAGLDHVFALSADDISAALGGAPVDLGARDEVGAWTLLGGAAFRDGLAFIAGDGFTEPVTGVRFVEGTPGAAPVDVLRVVDACTSVELVDPFDGDLLVGVSDASGRRLLHVRTDG